MDNKKIIIIVVAVIAVIAIAGVVLSSGMSNKTSDGKTTHFSNAFMEGEFTGDVKLVNNDSGYMQSYEDSQHGITYNISTVDNSSALMDVYYVQGIRNPDQRSFNGNEWNIYFSQAIQGNNTNETINVVICQSQGEKQGYLIYMIVDSKSDLNVTLNTFGEPYESYVEPLLKSLTLKQSSDVPKISEEFGLSDSEFAQQLELIQQYKAGNTSALEGAQ